MYGLQATKLSNRILHGFVPVIRHGIGICEREKESTTHTKAEKLRIRPTSGSASDKAIKSTKTHPISYTNIADYTNWRRRLTQASRRRFEVGQIRRLANAKTLDRISKLTNRALLCPTLRASAACFVGCRDIGETGANLHADGIRRSW